MTAAKRSFGSFPARVGLPADLACFAIFVVLGRQSHDLGGGLGWFATVFWPFAAAWVGAVLVVRPYSPSGSWRRVAMTLLLTVPIAMALRAFLTGRSIAISFVIVSVCFSGLFLFTWRGIATAATRFR